MNAADARTAIKSLGEFVEAKPHTDPGFVLLTFVRYEPGARGGKFHRYKYLTLSIETFQEIASELR